MGRLMLRREGGELGYFLEGLMVENGCRVDLRLPDGSWAGGRLSWDGDAYHCPTMEVEMGGQTIATIRLPINAELRWPRKLEREPSIDAPTFDLGG